MTVDGTFGVDETGLVVVHFIDVKSSIKSSTKRSKSFGVKQQNISYLLFRNETYKNKLLEGLCQPDATWLAMETKTFMLTSMPTITTIFTEITETTETMQIFIMAYTQGWRTGRMGNASRWNT